MTFILPSKLWDTYS